MTDEMTSTLSTEELLSTYPAWSFWKTDRNGSRYFTDNRCHRCGGRGRIACYGHVDGGICFACGGSGKATNPDVMKVLTPEHAEALRIKREAAAEKRQAAHTAELIATRSARLAKAGFAQEGTEYVIYRAVGNTYKVKDELKAADCRYNPTVGWCAAHPVDGFEFQRLTEDEVLADKLRITWKGKEEVESLFTENKVAAEESCSEWQGEVGEAIELTAEITFCYVSENRFGVSYMYALRDANGNAYRWSTQKKHDVGSIVSGRAQVKDHDEYKGVKQTVITRVKEK